MRTVIMFSAILILAGRSVSGDQHGSDVQHHSVFNADSKTYDNHPSMTIAGDGAMWIAWHAYADGREQINLRRVAANGSLGDTEIVNVEGSVHGPPIVVTDVGESMWVVWSTLRNSRWRVVARARRGGQWQPQVTR